MRLNQYRQEKLEPKRMTFAIQQIEKLGYTVTRLNSTTLEFYHKNKRIIFHPYSGWATGASINDGRGLALLIHQLKN